MTNELTTERLRELLAICESAGKSVPGKWEAELYRYPLGDTGDYDHCAVVRGVFGNQQLARPFANVEDLGHDADAQKNVTAHIAAFDPPTCAALAREVLELRATENCQLCNKPMSLRCLNCEDLDHDQS